MLLAVQVALFVVAATLTVCTALDRMPPPLLLTFTFLLGVGQALTLPTWQAVIPDVGALLMPRVREHVAANRLLVLSGTVYGLALLVVATVANTFVVGSVLVAAGLAWMIQVSRMNASLQLFLPNWVRARGFAVYQVVYAGGQALEAPSRT